MADQLTDRIAEAIYAELRRQFEGGFDAPLVVPAIGSEQFNGTALIDGEVDLVAAAEAVVAAIQPVIDADHLERQRVFSLKTFGPGPRTDGVLDHISKELDEIRAAPTDVDEWVDVIILAFDGAWRAGWEPQEIIDAIKAKQERNEQRSWPDWRTADPGKAIEHVR